MRRPSATLSLIIAIATALGIAATALPSTPAEARAPAGQYIVRFKDTAVSAPARSLRKTVKVGDVATGWRVDGTRIKRRLSAVRSMGVRPRHVFKHGIGGFSAKLTSAQVERLRDDPSVAGLDIDAPVSVEGDRVEGNVVSVASISPQRVPTGVRRIYADDQPLAHIGSRTDTNVDIAVIDTGIAAHPDLRIAGGVNCSGAGGSSYSDVYGHGTHVAGIIGARDNGVGIVGVVPGARLWAIKSMGNDGHGTTSDILCGLDWMIGQQQSATGPKFLSVNMSIAGPLVYPNRPCGVGTGDAYHQLVCAALDSGIVVAVAAANDHRVVNQRPAIYEEPITVGAIADFDGKPGGKGKQKNVCPWYSADQDDTYANFSDWGAVVDILAPGKCILSTYTKGRYAWMSGTSMATPHVAGAAALYRMRYPSAKPEQVIQALVYAGTRDWRTGSAPDGRSYRLLQVKKFTPPPTFSVSAGTGLLGGEGTSRGIKISIKRKNGHTRPISVRASSDPIGVGYQTLKLPTRDNSGTLHLLGTDALSSGSYDVIVTASDGEVQASTTVRITVDADAPDITLTSPTPGTTVVQTNHSVRVSAHGSDRGSGIVKRTLQRRKAPPSGLMNCDGVTFVADGGEKTVSGSGPYSVSGPSDGVCYQWVLRTTDKAGNTSVERSGAVWMDSSAPITPGLSATGDAAARGSTVWYRSGASGRFTVNVTGRDPQSGITALSVGQITGSGWDSGSQGDVSLDSSSRTASRARNFSFGRSSAASSFTVTSVDGVGLRKTSTIHVKPDTASPGLTITSPVKQTWLGSDTATVRYRATDDGSGVGKVTARQERAPLPSRSAGCGGVHWVSDGSAAAATVDRFTATDLQPGTCYRWVITATDRLGHARSRTTGPAAIDPTIPVVGGVQLTMARRTVGTSGSIPFTATWRLGRAPVGTTSFQLARTTNGGDSWQSMSHSPASSKSERTTIDAGDATTVSVRARSTTGARSAWVSSHRVTPRLVEENAGAVTTSSGWSRVARSSASGDHRLEATKHKAALHYSFTGSSIGLVAATARSLGHAIIRIDGKRVATISLKSSDPANRLIVWTRSLSNGKHSITVQVKDGRVVVDGFVVTQIAKGATR